MSNLKRIRSEYGITQGQLAVKSHVKLRTIRAYEQGYRDINKASYENLSKLATALKCSVNELLEE